MTDYDPSLTSSHKVGLFGLPSTYEESKVILIPVPWEVTTSYGNGTSMGPEAILKASPQIDLFDRQLGKNYEQGYHMLPLPEEILNLNNQLKPLAQKVRDELEEHGRVSDPHVLNDVNAGCEKMRRWVFESAKKILAAGKIPAVVGGDHSSPLGLIEAVSEAYQQDLGVLHVDAHADLRDAYQGFQHSHASIMFNVMTSKLRPKKLVQVAIRDFCEEEFRLTEDRPDITTFFDLDLKEAMFGGRDWKSLCEEIVSVLPQKTYVSFDIDGLSPEYCPNTGTPVPGGLSFDQAVYLIGTIVRSKRQIVGFDLNEVAPGADEWDGNVGARLLYKLCGWTVQSTLKT